MNRLKKAIIFGASGFVGYYLLDQLLQHHDYERITAIVRKPLPIHHPKLTMLIGDYDSLPTLRNQIEADEVFITLGGTTPTIDLEYPVLAARIAQEKGAQSVFIITAVGASLSSRLSYLRVKGEIERNIISLEFEHTHIFRLSMIMGGRKGAQLKEKIILSSWKVLNPFFMGGMNLYKGIKANNVAKAMCNAANQQADKVKIYHWKEMNDLLT